MVEGLIETLHPQKGGGVVESVVVLVLVGALIYMNIKGVKIDPLFEKIITIYVSYTVGTNVKKKVKEREL